MRRSKKQRQAEIDECGTPGTASRRGSDKEEQKTKRHTDIDR